MIEFMMIPGAPTPVAPFSHVVAADGWLFVTGQMPTDPLNDAAPLPEGVVAAQLAPERAKPAGNRSPQHAPQGVLPANGEDRWVAFSVQSYAQLRRLVALAGLGGYDDPALLSIAARRRIEERLLAELAGWSRGIEAEELVRRLRGAGIAAGLVSHAGDLATHPEFEARGFMRPIRVTPEAERRHPGVPWTTSHPGSLVFAPPPALGEHSRRVLRDVLGYDEPRIDELLSRLEERRRGNRNENRK